MRVKLNLMILGAGIFFGGCGSKDDSPADFYQSCQVSIVENSVDFSYCFEAKNSTDLQPKCEEQSGVFAQTQCDVPYNTKGCSYKKEGVDVIEWYTAEAWTDGRMTSDCAEETDGTIVTKS